MGVGVGVCVRVDGAALHTHAQAMDAADAQLRLYQRDFDVLKARCALFLCVYWCMYWYGERDHPAALKLASVAQTKTQGSFGDTHG